MWSARQWEDLAPYFIQIRSGYRLTRSWIKGNAKQGYSLRRSSRVELDKLYLHLLNAGFTRERFGGYRDVGKANRPLMTCCHPAAAASVCTENLIRVDVVMESPKLAE
jgi:hypothetical protein